MASSSLSLKPFILLLLLLLLLFQVDYISSETAADTKAYSDFLTIVPHRSRISPSRQPSACNWSGVECINGDGPISSIRLPATGLVGPIPANTIGKLTDLRILSLRSNGLTGEPPTDFSNLQKLRSLFLQDNFLSGPFPSPFSFLINLTRLDISSNKFNGSLPPWIPNMKGLKFLFLQNNNFSGSLPDLPGLNSANFSNNNFTGSIPKSLSLFPSSAFGSNQGLCGSPLPPCPEIRTEKKRKRKKGLSKWVVVGICVGAVGIVMVAAVILVFVFRKTKKDEGGGSGGVVTVERGGGSSSKEEGGGGGETAETEKNKLVFMDRGAYRFDLEDLLRASAEVLGKGSVGTSYKALLEDGTAVVVKRLKDVGVSRKDFEAQMELLSHIKHENVVPVRAYYYSKDEKLLVTDYIPGGSLSSLLHGSREGVLGWEERVRIAMGVAKGLAYIHSTGRVIHGNLKSSNILITSRRNEGGVCDYGLSTLFATGGGGGGGSRTGGYRAPEVVETRRGTAKGDVYSFGVVVLELLTGRAANQGGGGEEEGAGDLPRWVQSVVREEWTAEVFDTEMGRGGAEEDMVQLLQLAMSCVSPVPDQRPPMAEVLRLLQEIGRD